MQQALCLHVGSGLSNLDLLSQEACFTFDSGPSPKTHPCMQAQTVLQ